MDGYDRKHPSHFIPKKYVLVCCCGFTRKLSVLDRINRCLYLYVGLCPCFLCRWQQGTQDKTRLACWNACRPNWQSILEKSMRTFPFFLIRTNYKTRFLFSSELDWRPARQENTLSRSRRRPERYPASILFRFLCLPNFYSDSHS